MDDLVKETNVLYNVLCFFISENSKIFDVNDSRLYWRTVFHLAMTFHHTYAGLFALSIDLSSDQEEIANLRKYRIFFLTGWNFCFQTTFLFLATAHDVLQWLDKHDSTLGKRLRYARDIVFSGFMFPTTLFVTSMFWLVYWVDRELVFPTVFDSVVPWWFNHCVHTNIAVVLLLETLLQARRHPVDRKVELISVAIVNIGYAIVYYTIYFTTHRWLYGVFGTMTWWQICLYQLTIWISAAIFYFIQYPINRLIHGSEENDKFDDTNDTNGIEGANGKSRVEESDVGVINDNESIGDKSWNLKYRNVRDEMEQRTRK